VSVHLLRSLLDVYDQRMDDVLEMIREARAPGWWRQYGVSDKAFVALETAATQSSAYELSFVHGLLQTADYAAALFNSGQERRDADWIANMLAVRMIRQERLTDEEHPLQLNVVMHQSALHYPVGGSAVMRNQMLHLALITELPTVTLQIIPTTLISNEALVGPFTVLDFSRAGQPSICYALHALGDERQDKSEFVEPARLRFAHLRSLALDPDKSVALIEQVANDVWSS
jgi:hypothetical protein